VSPTWVVAVLALAAAVVVAIYIPRSVPADDTTSPELTGLPPGAVAVLIDAGRPVWDRGTTIPTGTGSALNPGTLKLKSGVAEIAFRGGGEVLIEGPADFDVTGPDGGFLRRGRLAAKVPGGTAFRVAMPGVTVTDAGGEYGLVRDEAGQSEVHAFAGKVGADPAGQPTRWIEKAAARIDAAGRTITPMPLNAVAFAHLRPEVRVADASVRGGRFADQNYGTSPLLMVKQSIADYSWESYLRFDLAGVHGRVAGAVVRLVPVRVGMAVVNAAAVADDEPWGETAITWDTAPAAAGPQIARWIAEEGKPVTFDVTRVVQDAIAGDKHLTLRIFAPNYKRGGSHVQYGSREGAPEARPQLLITTTHDAEAARPVHRRREPWFVLWKSL
jgi:hypothetical protein